MRRGTLGRVAFTVALAAPPLVVAAISSAPVPLLVAVPTIAAATAGLLVVDDLLRRLGFRSVAACSVLLLLYGTGLLWQEAWEPGWAVAAFLAGALLTRAWAGRDGLTPRRATLEGVALAVALGALSLLAEIATGWVAAPLLRRPALLDSLFSPVHGLAFWTPVVTLGLLGLARLAARGRAYALGALTALAVLAVANAASRPWWSGAFANARALPALGLVAIGLAAALQAVRAAAQERPGRLLTAGGGLLVLWNVLLMTQYRRETIPRDGTVSFAAVAENGARLFAAAVGAPPAWPANWAFAARERLPPARYDLLAGRDLLAVLPAQVDVGDLESDAALLGAGWSVRHPCGEAVCRQVEGRAVAYLPVVDPRAAELRVRAQGAGTLAVSVNGWRMGQGTLGQWTEVAAPLPRARLRRGANEVVLEVSPGGRALVDALRLLPAPEAR